MSATRLLVLDSKRVLKMYPPLVDVDSIAENMRRASGAMPVASIHSFGRSGNCAYILMDYIPGHDLASVKCRYGEAVTAVAQVLEIARLLSTIGLAHNDWHIVGVIDCDFCIHAMHSAEYRARICRLSHSVKRWSYAFLTGPDGHYGASVDANPVGGEAKLVLHGQPLVNPTRANAEPLPQPNDIMV